MTSDTTAGDGSAFDADGVAIAYDDVGEGVPVVLLHGFASDRRANWRRTGWYDALVEDGRRVLALDLRGHGASGKPRDPDEYGHDRMAADVVGLLDHLGLDAADVVGYSMGGRVAVQLLVDHPTRVRAAVLGGVSLALLRGPPNREVIATALTADSMATVDHPLGRRFRGFAEKGNTDLEALATAMRAQEPLDLDRLDDVANPVFVVAGAEDSLAGDPGALADRLPRGEAGVAPGCNHMNAVGNPGFRAQVLEFLDRQGG